MPAIFCVLHNNKKHVGQTSCELVFLHAARKSTAIFCQREIKAYNEMERKQNVRKHADTQKIALCQVFTYP